MLNFVVRVYRTQSDDPCSASGIIEDTESGQTESFQSFNELQSILAHSIGTGQHELSYLTSLDLHPHDNVAVIE